MLCPSCKNPITELTSLCEWCGKRIIEPKNVIDDVQIEPDNKGDHSKDNTTHIYTKLDQELISLLKKGDTLQAIKLMREHSGLGKKEAEFYIYELFDQELISLLKKGDTLQAIKLMREGSGLGLEEAKFYIYELCEKEGINISKSGCFIATSCFGDYNSPEVIKFRLFRDQVLQKSLFGKMFISTYYTFSPYLVRMMDKSDFLKYTVRQYILHPLLNIVEYFIK
jgi:ribosomal protein L7/L12